MPPRRFDRPRPLRSLGVALLILSVGHVPWPRADYHNIRHHDGPGESCPFHDHLLRWHPDSGSGSGAAEDVAVLHWHWAPPTTALSDNADLPSARAQVQDWPGVTWDDAPHLASPAPVRWMDTPAASGLATPDPAPEVLAIATLPRAGPGALRDHHTTFTSGISLTVLLRRWTC